MFRNNYNFSSIILCGGLGTRISEFTNKIPKPMIKIQNKPLIGYVLKKVLSSKCKNIILPLGYKGEIIKKYVKKEFKSDLGRINFFETGKYTSVSNRIKKIKHKLLKYENFFLINGDTIFDADLNKMLNFHILNDNLLTLSYSDTTTTWGTFFLDKKNNIKKFSKNDRIEYIKPQSSNLKGFRNSGISIINSKCLKNFNFNVSDFEVGLFNKYIKKKSNIMLYNLNLKLWYPVETINDYNALNKNKELLKKLKKI